MLGIVSVYASLYVKIDFSFIDLIPPDSMAFDFIRIDREYIKSGFTTTVYVENAEVDYATAEAQLQFQDFNDKLQRCHGCDESWFKKNSLNSWYDRLLTWYRRGDCFLDDNGLRTFEKTIPYEKFYVCLRTFMETDEGESINDMIRFSNETNPIDQRIIGFKQQLQVKQIDWPAYQGV